jgi:hypothetical protein
LANPVLWGGLLSLKDFEDAQIADFLRRSYFAVDGLWFVKAEERFGFEEAMALDEAVWSIMSKIQARKARELLAVTGNSVANLARAFSLKLTAERYHYETRTDADANAVQFAISMCPWYEILKSSNRTHIAEIIADRICKREFAGWTREFGQDIEIEFQGRLCIEREQCDKCTIVFRQRA